LITVAARTTAVLLTLADELRITEGVLRSLFSEGAGGSC
jgi:hypothetical protein